MPAILRLVVATICVVFSSISNANLRHIPSDLEDHLSQTLVSAISFDSEERAWVSTLRGVRKVTAKNILSEPSLATPFSDLIAQINVQDNSAFLTTTSGDIYHLTNESPLLAMRSPAKHPLKRGPFRVNKSSVGLLTDKGIHLVAFSHRNGALDMSLESAFIEGAFSSNALRFGDLGLCAARYHAVVCNIEERDGPSFQLYSTGGTSNIVFLDLWDKADRLVALSNSGSVMVLSSTFSDAASYFRISELEHSEVRCFKQWRDYALIGTDKGVLSVNLMTGDNVWLDFFSDIRPIGFEESSDGVWIYHESGVSLANESVIRNWPRGKYSMGLDILDIVEVNGATVVGTFDGLYFVDFDAKQPTRAWPKENTPKNFDRRISALAFAKGRLFAGTISGAVYEFLIDRDSFRIASKYSLPSGISSLASVDELLLIGTSKNGLHFLAKKLTSIPMPVSWKVSPSPITSINYRNDVDLVVSTSENEVIALCRSPELSVCGVQRLDSSFAGATLLNAKILSDRTILLGSVFGGLIRSSIDSLMEGTDLHPSSSLAVNNAPIFAIESVSDELTILGTDNAIHLLDRNTGQQRRFDRFDGLRNSNINHNASLVTRDKTVLLGGRFGVSAVKVDDLRFDVASQRELRLLAITSPSAGHVDIRKQLHINGIQLRYPASRLSLELSIGDYRSVSRRRYQFTLEGPETYFHEKFGLGQIEYIGIPPGDYVFHARAADAQGNWTSNEIAIPITVSSNLWPNIIVVSVYTVCGFVFLFVISLYFLQRKRHQRDSIEPSARHFGLERLEEDWQEERGAAERVINSILPSIFSLLDTVRLVIAAHLSSTHRRDTVGVVKSIDDNIVALKTHQALCNRTTLGDHCNLQALVEEIFASLTTLSPRADRYILLNETPSVDVSVQHSAVLALVIHEIVSFLIMSPEFRPHDPNPVLQLSISAEPDRKDARTSYSVQASDRLKLPLLIAELHQALPVTHQLIARFDGEIESLDRLGLELRVSLIMD